MDYCRTRVNRHMYWQSSAAALRVLRRALAQLTALRLSPMAKVAYRFVPCDDTGRPRENSQFTTIRDASEKIESGAIISADLLGFQEWEVVEVRESAGPLGSVSEADGTAIPLGGSIVCRGVRRRECGRLLGPIDHAPRREAFGCGLPRLPPLPRHAEREPSNDLTVIGDSFVNTGPGQRVPSISLSERRLNSVRAPRGIQCLPR